MIRRTQDQGNSPSERTPRWRSAETCLHVCRIRLSDLRSRVIADSLRSTGGGAALLLGGHSDPELSRGPWLAQWQVGDLVRPFLPVTALI